MAVFMKTPQLSLSEKRHLMLDEKACSNYDLKCEYMCVADRYEVTQKCILKSQ